MVCSYPSRDVTRASTYNIRECYRGARVPEEFMCIHHKTEGADASPPLWGPNSPTSCQPKHPERTQSSSCTNQSPSSHTRRYVVTHSYLWPLDSPERTPPWACKCYFIGTLLMPSGALVHPSHDGARACVGRRGPASACAHRPPRIASQI